MMLWALCLRQDTVCCLSRDDQSESPCLCDAHESKLLQKVATCQAPCVSWSCGPGAAWDDSDKWPPPRQCGRPAPTWTRLNKYLQLLRVLSGEHVPSAQCPCGNPFTHWVLHMAAWSPRIVTAELQDCWLQNMVLGAVQCPALAPPGHCSQQ